MYEYDISERRWEIGLRPVTAMMGHLYGRRDLIGRR